MIDREFELLGQVCESCECCEQSFYWSGEAIEGTWQIDPFQEEVYEEIVIRCLCDSCYETLKDDI